MDISVVGTGYVGLVCGAGFSEMGNTVICVDSNREKIDTLNNGAIPIYEPGLKEMVQNNMSSGTLSFTTNIREAIEKTSICFIAVGTPMGEDGAADTKYVLDVAQDIGRYMNKHMFVVDKSTVPIGTADKVRECIAEQLRARGSVLTFDVISNPEFLKEGVAIADFLKPDRVIVGLENARSLDVMQELYSPFTKNHDNLIIMDIRSAEATKYVANAMLATKISFINEMANICELVNADINKVRIGIGSDSRIGYHFLYPGCGYGGSCFPKDVRALISTANDFGYSSEILKAVDNINTRQKKLLAQKVLQRFNGNLNGRMLAVWGLAFKPGTDDMRESPAVSIINHLIEAGAQIKAYDPKATETAKSLHFKDLPGIEYCRSKYDALTSVDAMLLITEWKEFRSPDFEEIKQRMRSPIIFDGRNQYNSERLTAMGIEYHQIGVVSPPVHVFED